MVELAVIWHRTFGNLKCHWTSCPICSDTDWPMASWVIR